MKLQNRFKGNNHGVSMLFAGKIVLFGTILKEVSNRLNEWK